MHRVVNTALFFILFLLCQLCLGQIFVDKAEDLGVNGVILSDGFGAGISVFDFDKDGLDDISFATNDGNYLFYRNTGSGFELLDLDVSIDVGNAKHLLWVDFDNDLDYDLLTTSYFGEVHLYENDGDLNLIDITESAGLPTNISSYYGASFCDVNRDGYLDLFIGRYEPWFNQPENPSIEPNRWSRFLINNGDGSFADVTDSIGIVIPPSPVFQSSFLDYNKDLWPDLYVIVDRIPENELFLNNQGLFENMTEDFGIGFPVNDPMSNSIADFNNDGYLDIFMTNNGEVGFQNPTILLQNENGESFNSVADLFGLEIYVFGWGALWIDANNDGWNDLYFTTPGYDPDHFFLNENGEDFIDAYDEIMQDSETPSLTLGKGDFNQDGRYDLAISGYSPHPPSVLINQTSDNHFIKITLNGTVSNSMAIGTWIEIYEEGIQYSDYTLCGTNYISQDSQHRIYGFEETDGEIDSLILFYPSGHIDRYYNLTVDSEYEFYEGETYSLDILASASSVCQGDTITLDAGVHLNYQWNTNDTTRFLQVTESGTYEVEVVNEFGIVSTATVSITINPAPIIAENITPNLCFGDSLAEIVLINQTGVQPDSVIWNNENSGVLNDSIPAGTYTYNYVDLNGCSYTDSIDILDPPQLIVFFSSEPSDPDQSNGTITVTSFGGTPPYSIYLNNETVEGTINGVAPGDYDLSVQDSNGCVKDTVVTVESTLGLYTHTEHQIRIFPNPIKDQFSIQTKEPIQSIQILNILGEEQKLVGVDGKNGFNISHLASGIYFLTVCDNSGNIFTKRIIKE